MRIVVLDGFPANPGDLSWDDLAALGEIEVYPRSRPEEVADRLEHAAVAVTNKAIVDRSVIERCADLRLITVTATGTNIVDLAAARERGIPVANVPGYSTASVAQLTFALILQLANNVAEHAQWVRTGGWQGSPDFSTTLSPQVELSGRRLGVIGLGEIGHSVARIGSAMGMRVAALRRPRTEHLPDIDHLSLDELLATSDVVSLHCPLTEETRGLIGPERLAIMRRGSWLINTARGPLLDEAAVADALHSGHLGGAALDVLSIEPPHEGSPLIGAPNCHITPHIAWATRAARERLLAETVGNVRAFIEGRPRNVVNGPLA